MICHPVYDLSSRAKRGIRSLLNIKPIAGKLKTTDGAEIAEAALVLPLVFMLLLGIVWFGRAFNIYSTITQAAQQGAIIAARDSCATCAGGGALPDPATVDGAVVAVLQASSLETGQIKQWEANNPTPGVLSCPAPAPAASCKVTAHHIWVCSSVLLNSSTQPTQCGAMVSFQFPFKFYLPFTSLNMQQTILSAQAQSRMEN
jgi:TadE-like protein